jgi:hypothetical protein
VAFQKAKFIRNDTNQSFNVQFNPATLSGTIVGSVKEQKNQQQYSEAVIVSNTGIASKTLNMTLIFDEYPIDAMNPSAMDNERSVKFRIDKFEQFMSNNTTISFAWGNLIFEGYINNISVNYEIFNSSGNPVRASVQVAMTEAGMAKESGFLDSNQDTQLLDEVDIQACENEEILMSQILAAVGKVN